MQLTPRFEGFFFSKLFKSLVLILIISVLIKNLYDDI